MAATAAVNRPPPDHPGPNGGNLNFRPNSGAPPSGPQDPGLHGTSQDPGPSSNPHHHMSARPIFYIPAPPPPPFLHYQWPMPFSYNPFSGFPGMGYGMVMPPFPPPPYMEAPAYILPHPHIQPVDYRRMLHPHFQAPNVPSQNPNLTCRIRTTYAVPVRETVNSEVQTEPGVGGYREGSPLIGSDSGHGTASNSPSSSSSSSQKQCSSEVESYTLPNSNAKDLQTNRTCTVKHRFNVPHQSQTKSTHPCIKETLESQKSCKDAAGQETVRPCANSHYNMSSVGSLEGMVPVCSSSQQEDDVKERRVSVPDILMSWGGGIPQPMILKMADKELPQNKHQLPCHKNEVEHENLIHQILAETRNIQVVADGADVEGIFTSNSETLVKILKLPFAFNELLSESRGENEPLGLTGPVTQCLPYRDEPQQSLNESQKLSDDEHENGINTNPHKDLTEIIPCQMKKMNESVWSVESLAPFIPSKEWLLQNSMFEPEGIIEMTEEAENDNLIVKPTQERRQICRLSSSDSTPMSDSWLIFSTPAGKLNLSKKPEMETKIDTSEMREQNEGQCMVSSEKSSPTLLQSKILPTPPEEEVDENRSSEPEANQSPNQESLIENAHQEKSLCSLKQGQSLDLVGEEKCSSTSQMVLQNGVAMEVDNGADEQQEVSHIGNKHEYAVLPDQKIAEVSLLKGHLVDCGTQCTQFQELCLCERSSMGLSRRHPFKYSDMKRENNGKAEGFYVNCNMQKNQKRQGHWRSRGQEKQSSQQEAYNGYSGKPGKSRGGNGRNSRY